jgi:hypothetical protein
MNYDEVLEMRLDGTEAILLMVMVAAILAILFLHRKNLRRKR